ncbi:hypothetical protein V5F53_04965 [Xanthobacter sp. V4C-4]|uniref:hypothetical protein n=1 Tax=Xanthobacter cornucopiae TaxID=3119924 RepID=UPI0037285C57
MEPAALGGAGDLPEQRQVLGARLRLRVTPAGQVVAGALQEQAEMELEARVCWGIRHGRVLLERSGSGGAGGSSPVDKRGQSGRARHAGNEIGQGAVSRIAAGRVRDLGARICNAARGADAATQTPAIGQGDRHLGARHKGAVAAWLKRRG